MRLITCGCEAPRELPTRRVAQIDVTKKHLGYIEAELIRSRVGLVQHQGRESVVAYDVIIAGRPGQGARVMDWLEATNFAIDSRALNAASREHNSNNIRGVLGHDLFFGLCWLHDESRPFPVRPPKQIPEATYKQEYGDRIYDQITVIRTALAVVRDIFWFTETRFDPHSLLIAPPERYKSSPEFLITEALFDFPNFEPFRYAYLIIKDTLTSYPERREMSGGDLCYHIQFKTIEESPRPKDVTIRLSDHVRQLSK